MTVNSLFFFAYDLFLPKGRKSSLIGIICRNQKRVILLLKNGNCGMILLLFYLIWGKNESIYPFAQSQRIQLVGRIRADSPHGGEGQGMRYERLRHYGPRRDVWCGGFL